MGFAWKVVVFAVVFVGVGVLTDRLVLAHAAGGGQYELQVRMGAAAAGLFAGGVAATLAGLGMWLGRKKS